ncbi:VOC family protein [Patescibacteria group bacterium]|nr:VOC family protein [Patescibacteria group bacterium]
MKLRNVIFYVRDIEAARDFYRQLGFKEVQNFGKFISYDVGREDMWFSIMESDDPCMVPGKQVCVFWAKNIQYLYKKVLELDIAVDTKLYKADFGETFAIRDPDGNKIEFVQS